MFRARKPAQNALTLPTRPSRAGGCQNRVARPLVRPYAHRGGSNEESENTAEAFAHAVQLGYRFIETDVRLTADSQVIIQHDELLTRPWLWDKPVHSLTYEQVKQLRTATGARPILLAEALKQYPEVVFNIEPKTDEVIDPLLEVIAQYDAFSRVCFSSFYMRRLKRLRSHPQARTSAAPSEILRLVLTGRLGLKWLAKKGFTSAISAQVPEKYGWVRIVTPRFVAAAHAAGLRVEVWTVDDVKQMVRLLEQGVDGIMTDSPSVLRKVLKERGQWQQLRP